MPKVYDQGSPKRRRGVKAPKGSRIGPQQSIFDPLWELRGHQGSLAKRGDVVGVYLTRSGKEGARIVVGGIRKDGSPWYMWSGAWGAGSGHDRAHMEREVRGWLRNRRGVRVDVDFFVHQGSPAKLDLKVLAAQARAKTGRSQRSGGRKLWESDPWFVLLENTMGTSNKFWKIEGIYGSNTVRATWGPIGREQGRQMISVDEAVKRMKKKLKDGYVVVEFVGAGVMPKGVALSIPG